MERTNRLYRSTTSRVFGGVAGGIAEYFDVDPIIIRMLFVIIASTGAGLFVYFILWIAIPPRPIDASAFHMGAGGAYGTPPPPPGNSEQGGGNSQAYNAEPIRPDDNRMEKTSKGGLIGGLILITLGALFLADRFIPRIDFGDLWPVILVVVGAVLIFTNLSDRGSKPGNQ